MKKAILTLGAVIALFASAAFAAVNVNTASAEQLTSLTGIGEAKAQAIVDYRDANGGFESKGELTEVDGIGDATLEKIRDEVTVGGNNQ